MSRDVEKSAYISIINKSPMKFCKHW